MLMPDVWFEENGDLIFEPFCSNQISKLDHVNQISFGVSSYGYDVRLAEEMKLFVNAYNGVIDPKNFDEKNLMNLELQTEKVELPNNGKFQKTFWPVERYFILPPNSFALGSTLEKVTVPRDCAVICLGKSTYARCGLVVNTTPLEPEWTGNITLEFSNTTNLPIKIYAGEGIAQLLFLKGTRVCKTSYKDRKGKYQGQKNITFPKV